MSEAVFQPIESSVESGVESGAHAADARYAIERALSAAAEATARRELWIDDQYIGTLARDAFEFTVEWGKLIFSWWDETHSQNWRVTSYVLEAGEVRLRATRGWGHALTTVVLRDQVVWQAAQTQKNLPLIVKRQAYAETLPQWLAEHFPTARILRVVNSQRRQSLAAIGYTKVTLRFGTTYALALGVSANETPATIDAIVATGLVWLTEFNARRAYAQQARRLIFCVPHDHADTIIERLTFLSATHCAARLECLTVNQQSGELTPVALVSQVELLTTHMAALQWPEPHSLAEPQQRAVERITALANDVIEMRPLVSPQDSARLLWHGLEFARVNATGRAEFGIAGATGYERQTLNERNFAALQTLVAELTAQRCAKPADRRHPLYRLRPEAWLESCLRRDITALNAEFDARFVYSQIPAWQAESRSVLDLLTVTHTGRLAILEIKEREDGQLPLQGLDYWWRIEQARWRGELTARGLFPGVALADQPPLLYLVAPRLRFHRSFANVTRCLSQAIEVYRIGLNANWRETIRVFDCQRMNKETND